MHIEVWFDDENNPRQPWHWHFKNKGRITAAAESFPSKGHAIRAAKAVVKAVLKAYFNYPPTLVFSQWESEGFWVITWVAE
jgi:hypothetical protein